MAEALLVTKMGKHERRVLSCVERYWLQHRRAPSRIEIRRDSGLSGAQVALALEALEQGGHIGRTPGVARSISMRRSPLVDSLGNRGDGSAFAPLLGSISVNGQQPAALGLGSDRCSSSRSVRSLPSGGGLFAELRLRDDDLDGDSLDRTLLCAVLAEAPMPST
jgi:hypothetical protein